MAPPFAQNPVNPWLYFALGTLSAVVAVLVTYHWLKTGGVGRDLEEELELQHKSSIINSSENEKDKTPRVDRIGLSKKAEDVLGTVVKAPMLQNELPDELKVSKATVSNAVSELRDRGLIQRKKKANTYLIEPDLEAIEDEQR